MKKFNLILLLAVIITFNCARKVEKEQDELSKMQVDLQRANPLAPFYNGEDSSKFFESFSSYPHKKVENKINLKREDQILQVNFFVQVGLTDSYDEIYQLKNQLIHIFPEENIEIKYDPPFYRVLIGPYKSKTEANEIFSILERKNFSSIRIRTETPK